MTGSTRMSDEGADATDTALRDPVGGSVLCARARAHELLRLNLRGIAGQVRGTLAGTTESTRRRPAQRLGRSSSKRARAAASASSSNSSRHTIRPRMTV